MAAILQIPSVLAEYPAELAFLDGASSKHLPIENTNDVAYELLKCPTFAQNPQPTLEIWRYELEVLVPMSMFRALELAVSSND